MYTYILVHVYLNITIYILQPLNTTVLKITSVPHSIDDLVRQEHGHMLATPNHKLGASHCATPRGFEGTTFLGKSEHVLFGSKNAI